MKLRGYQEQAVLRVLEEWIDNHTTLVTLPTGTGKTVVAAEIIKRMRQKYPNRIAMFVAHTEELIFQAKERIREIAGIRVEVEMGEHKAAIDKELFEANADCIVASIQTLTAGGDGSGRMSKFNPDQFSVLVIDEAHHATSPSYRRVIDYFLRNNQCRVLGITATPDRSDEEALGQVFQTVAFDYGLQDAIDDGWLVYPEPDFTRISSLDFSAVRTTAGDLNGKDLAAQMESEKNLHGVAWATLEKADGKRGIGFASSVDHARMLTSIFNRHKAGCASFIFGGTDRDERKQIIKSFADGSIQWLWNCGVLLEGFDDAGVEVLSMARPTESRALYAQMVGRGTRPHATIQHRLNNIAVPALRRGLIARSPKPILQVIDFSGNSGKHRLIHMGDILGGNVSDEAMEIAVERARKRGGRIDLKKEAEDVEEEMKKARAQAEARTAHIVGRATYTSQKMNPFDVLGVKPTKEKGWDKGKVLSEKMRNVLRKAGIDPDEVSYTHGKQLVGAMIERWEKNLCSPKQAALMAKHGVPDATNLTFDQARATIDAIAKNGWRLPLGFVAPTAVAKLPPRPKTAVPEPATVSEQTGWVGTNDDNVPF
jgi:superfamily II DNA or RNA helicase